MGAGLARLGWSVPALAASAAALHGPLMIGGFFGVVISLERAVAIGRRWAYLGPLAAGLGGIAAVAGMTAIAPWLLLAGSVVLLAASHRHLPPAAALFTFTLVAGRGLLGRRQRAMGGGRAGPRHRDVVARVPHPDDRRRATGAVALPASVASGESACLR